MALHIQTKQESAELGKRLFAGECTFFAGSNALENLPIESLPEIAFAGRSNVGKSSLINALTRQSALARISKTPGRTQQINFFDLSNKLILVDLPGYGYAKASKSKISGWTQLVHTYLKGRPTLNRICLLIDARHGIKPSDETLMATLDQAAVVYQIILTKIDKVSHQEIETKKNEISLLLNLHPAGHPEIIETSSRNFSGIPKLRASLAALAAPDQVS